MQKTVKNTLAATVVALALSSAAQAANTCSSPLSDTTHIKNISPAAMRVIMDKLRASGAKGAMIPTSFAEKSGDFAKADDFKKWTLKGSSDEIKVTGGNYTFNATELRKINSKLKIKP
ncbi:hypothetical protein EZJ43_11480 [Pedobacter changchengzhani]|uniref:Uncharacterized protein n=1 Tax=Pedobacter changchengzhani TaxID=2529274 RepID=A0A4R5MK88_9SPHI|nr:hypothetical protein [Pedobacter changchengzhani]TDG35962.1 hypothetical protein EZJ43_11480 [Pedobacter changchengzhani]